MVYSLRFYAIYSYQTNYSNFSHEAFSQYLTIVHNSNALRASFNVLSATAFDSYTHPAPW